MGEAGPMLQEHLVTEYEITSILSQMHVLLILLWSCRSLVTALPSEIILSQWQHMDKKIKPLVGRTKSKARRDYFEVVMGETGPTLQEHLVTEYEITSILKPNAPLANITVDLRELGNDLNKRDHIIIVGGPGNSLDINYQYSFENDINCIAERSNNTNVRFEILFWRHDRPWINRKVRNVNLRLDRALMGCGQIPSSCY